MCIRDRCENVDSEDAAEQIVDKLQQAFELPLDIQGKPYACLLYTSDAADDLLCVDLGGRRLIKKKNTSKSHQHKQHPHQP